MLDAWVPVDQVDEDGKPLRKIGAVRVVVYLEDLGPVSLLKQKGFDIKNLLVEDEVVEVQPTQLTNAIASNPLPSEKYASSGE